MDIYKTPTLELFNSAVFIVAKQASGLISIAKHTESLHRDDKDVITMPEPLPISKICSGFRFL